MTALDPKALDALILGVKLDSESNPVERALVAEVEALRADRDDAHAKNVNLRRAKRDLTDELAAVRARSAMLEAERDALTALVAEVEALRAENELLTVHVDDYRNTLIPERDDMIDALTARIEAALALAWEAFTSEEVTLLMDKAEADRIFEKNNLILAIRAALSPQEGT